MAPDHFRRLLPTATVVLALAANTLISNAAEFTIGLHNFTLPDGFEIERVAAAPQVDRPIIADFDNAGNLYVADSSGSNDKPDKQLVDKPHRIVRLTSTKGDGRFDSQTVFADRMMFPEGAMFYKGSLYVSAPPSIWKLSDTNGDGIADAREEWVQAKTLTGCANDLHGPYAGPDGRVYWCKGAFASQTYPSTIPGGKPFTTRAAHIFRALEDGTGIEPVMTGGMDNPVKVVFTATGERIFTTTFFQHPAGGRRDGLVHAIYGGVYGKDHDVLDGHKRTGDLMPVLAHLGPAAPCGLIRVESDSLGDGYRENLFACSFNLHKLLRVQLTPDGATFKATTTDFLSSDNPDFHPTDVIEDADGSLLVIDTGGWYKICCPTSQLWKPDVLGAIYRIRRKGATPPADPRGSKIQWANQSAPELIELLGDARPAVTHRAMEELQKMGDRTSPALRDRVTSSANDASKANLAAEQRLRINAAWTLARTEGLNARNANRGLLKVKDESVQQIAAHAVALWRDKNALPELLPLLHHGSAQLRRVAAEALGRIGSKDAVPALLGAASALPGDRETLTDAERILEHSIIYALIEINDPTATTLAVGLGSTARGTRASLVAMDQMDSAKLKSDAVMPYLTAKSPILRHTASWTASHHPEWAGDLAAGQKNQIASVKAGSEESRELESQLVALASSEATQQLIAEACTGTSVAGRLVALNTIARANLKQVPANWVDAVTSLISDKDPLIARAAMKAARALVQSKSASISKLVESLRAVAASAATPADLRLEALGAIPGSLGEFTAETFEFLLQSLNPANPAVSRASAASVIARGRLTLDQATSVAGALETAGPLEITRLLAAFDSQTNSVVGEKVVASLAKSKGFNALRPDLISNLANRYAEPVHGKALELVKRLNADVAKQSARIEEMLKTANTGDIRRGQSIFNSPKAACATCHAIGYLGGDVGPDLTKIGQIRTERDLLESIVYPSASFVRSFEPMMITTKGGDEYSGVVRRDNAEEVVLVTGPNAEVRVAKSDITEMRPGTVSVMPAGLDQQLSQQELADLLAFLKATKW